MVERKNFSFYMATDFTEKLEKVQAHDTNLKTLSRSQALYFIVSNMAQNISNNTEPEEEQESNEYAETEGGQLENSDEQQS